MKNINLNVEDHQKNFDCKLILFLSGDKEFIKTQLFNLLVKLNAGEKPIQGTTVHYNGVETIATPIWDKKEYV